MERIEECWSDKSEMHMRTILKRCAIKSKQHEDAGYHFKKRNTYCGLPLVLIPVTMSPVSLLIDDGVYFAKYINACVFLVTGPYSWDYIIL